MTGDHCAIGELAGQAHVPVSTVRYYERRGLLHPEGRTSGNYRVYGPAALERLQFIRAAQDNGFTLTDIAQLVGFGDGDTPVCRQVQDLITHRLADMAARTNQLVQLQKTLRAWLQQCRRSERRGRCEVIDRLGVEPSGTRPATRRSRPQKKTANSRKP